MNHYHLPPHQDHQSRPDHPFSVRAPRRISIFHHLRISGLLEAMETFQSWTLMPGKTFLRVLMTREDLGLHPLC